MKTYIKYHKPWHQGRLDGMCGVYSIINSMKEIHGRKITDEIAEDLFAELCSKLNRDGKLYDVVTGGMSLKILNSLLDLSFKYVERHLEIAMDRKIAFRSTPDLNAYWERISDHIQNFGCGSVIVGLSGVHDHWSCIRKIRSKSILLADSGGLFRLLRSRCTTFESGSRSHRLHASQTVLIQW